MYIKMCDGIYNKSTSIGGKGEARMGTYRVKCDGNGNTQYTSIRNYLSLKQAVVFQTLSLDKPFKGNLGKRNRNRIFKTKACTLIGL